MSGTAMSRLVMSRHSTFHLAVALDGAGAHPAAWRDPSARPTELFDASYWVTLAQTAERGLLDFVSFDDTFGMQSSRLRVLDDRTDQVRGRLDGSLVAARVAPATEHIGLIPAITVTYPEPFHIASTTSTLDYVSRGRAGWQPRVSSRPCDARLVGTREPPFEGDHPPDDATRQRVTRELFDEATDAVEVVRRLWDSWEDDAVIKDVATGRFIDRDKLHDVDFEGRFFSVKGPSIVPRPPQGQPIVAALAHRAIPFEFAATSADIVFLTPSDTADGERLIAAVRAAERAVGRTGPALKLFADLVVFLASTPAGAAARKAELDDLAGCELRSDAAIFVGNADELADQLVAWHHIGFDGFRLRPGVIGHDLNAVIDDVVPALQRRGVFRDHYDEGSLRERLGLPRPASRYARSA